MEYSTFSDLHCYPRSREDMTEGITSVKISDHNLFYEGISAQFVVRVFILVPSHLEKSTRRIIRDFLLNSYEDMTSKEIQRGNIIFQQGSPIEIEEMKTHSGRMEVFQTFFEGLNVATLMKRRKFNLMDCEATLISAIQYRIMHLNEYNYEVNIGILCGEQTIRPIRIAEYKFYYSDY